MRILMLNDYRWAGGAEVVCDAEARALRAAGHEVRTLFAAESPTPRRLHLSAAFRYLSNARMARRAASELEVFRPDVVHLHNFYHEFSPAVLGPIGRWRREHTGRAVIVTAHDHHLICPDPGGRRFERAGGGFVARPAGPPWKMSTRTLLASRWDQTSPARSALRLLQHLWHYRTRGRLGVVDRVVTPSRDLAAAIGEGLGPHGPPVETVPSPIPEMESCEAPANEAEAARPTNGDRRPSRGPLRVTYAGRIAPEKGLLAALKAWPRSPDAELTVFGGGPDEPACRDEARVRALPVRFEGRVERSVVNRAMRRAHVVLVPSLVEEADGLAAVEGLHAGAALLAGDSARMRRLLGVDDATGVSPLGVVFDPRLPHTGREIGSLAWALAVIDERRRSGLLNNFDASPVLDGRSPAEHAASLVATYRAVARA